MSNHFRKAWLLLAVVSAFLVTTATAESHVRIVRLSYLNGQVQVDRGAGAGYEQALPNMPIVEGLKISTGADGVAELEFEDGSTFRITPETEIEVRQLELEDSGATLSTVAVLHGTAYVDFRKRKEDVFDLVLPDRTIALTHAVRLRAEVAQDEAELAVFNGEVDLTGFDQVVRVKKDQTVTFDFSDANHYTLAKDIEAAPYDDWSNEREKYRERYASTIDSGSSMPAYGLADLAYYGNSYDLPGYGWVWQPYGIGYGWDPFSSGYWNFYPSTGWIWCSYAPWGWYPYRFGSWAFAPGFGWVWSPGTIVGFAPWRPIPPVNGAPPGFKPPTRPVRPPATPATAIIAVGTAPVHGPGNKVYDASDPALAVRSLQTRKSPASAGGPTAGGVSTFRPSASSFTGAAQAGVPGSVRDLRRAIDTPENESLLGAMRNQDSYNRQFHKEMEKEAPAYVNGPPSNTGNAPERAVVNGARSGSGSQSTPSHSHQPSSSSSWHPSGSSGGSPRSSGGSMHSSGGGSVHSGGGGFSGGGGASHSSGGGGGSSGGGGGRHP